MKDACAPFRGKKITLLGLGLLGRGVGDAEFLAKCADRVVVTDKKTEAELAASVEKLEQYPNIEFHLGGHRTEDLTETDMVIKAAGVPVDSPEIAAARAKNIPVAMSTALFAKYAMEAGAKIVGITGTRGKSTVTQMIYQTLAKKFGARVHLGGNVRGISTLAMLPQIESGDICVLELDSWQLQGFGELQISPQIAVFTNLMSDHQNYYKSTDDYFADKANIFMFQKRDDVHIVGKDIFQKIKAARPAAAPLVPPAIPDDWKLNVIGAHNRENASLAAEALHALGLNGAEIKSGLESFEAVEGRLQFVKESNGMKIYNDNNATTPEATLAALAAIAPEKPVLIIGGADKGLSLDVLAKFIPQLARAVVFLKGTGTDKLLGLVVPELLAKKIPQLQVDSMQDAVTNAVHFAQGSGVILFSPAFASFGMFKNEYERNDQFLAMVRAL